MYTNSVNFPKQKVYYVTNKDWILMELPPANFLDQRLKDCDELNELFEGDCEFKYGVALVEDENQQQEVVEDEENAEKKDVVVVRPL